MPLSRTEAESALTAISKTEQTSKTAFGYEKASPHLILWGVVWMIGYGATYVRPGWSSVWVVLAPIGSLISLWIGSRTHSRERKGHGARATATILAVFAFITATAFIMRPTSGAQVAAFIPMVVALFYSLFGIWTRGVRMLIAGLGVAALTLGGYFWLPHIFLLWMAVVGGGGLILGGLWLRRA